MDMTSLEKFKISNHVTFTTGKGNLPKIVIHTDYSDAEIYLHGAHITSFTPSGQKDILWLSPLSPFHDGKAIRGGIPVCFPWFGNHPVRKDLPAHGFVRTKEWNMESSALFSDGSVCLVLSTTSDQKTLECWPFEFRLQLKIVIGQDLQAELITTNIDNKPFMYDECFHTYFAVENVNSTRIDGLEGLCYQDRLKLDKPDILREALAPNSAITLLFPKSPTDATISDQISMRVVNCKQDGFKGTVIWTPWQGAENTFPDIGAGWKDFLCLEAVNFGDYSVLLLPGSSHISSVRYSAK